MDTLHRSCLGKSPRSIIHRLWAVHPHWTDSIVLYDDGTMSRANGDSGRYSLEPFATLVLDWDWWETERLTWSDKLGLFQSEDNRFLVRFYPPPAVDGNLVSTGSVDISLSRLPDQLTNVIWSRSLGIAYYPIAKNACTSVKLALLESAGIKIQTRQEVHAKCPTWRSIRIENGILQFAAFEATSRSAEFVRFAVIRHPLDRLVSCYANKVVQGESGLPPRHSAARNFEEFILLISEDVLANEHFQPQVLSLPANLDVTLRFDSLKEDWDRMRSRFQLPLGRLSHQNQSSHKPWKDVFTPQLQRLAEELYADDLRVYYQLTSR